MSLLLASNHGQIIRVRPGLLRPWQPDPKVSLTGTVAVAETNLGFAGAAGSGGTQRAEWGKQRS